MQQKENLEKYVAKKSDHDLVTYAFDALWFLGGFIYVVFPWGLHLLTNILAR